jgi:hypothetical protein
MRSTVTGMAALLFLLTSSAWAEGTAAPHANAYVGSDRSCSGESCDAVLRGLFAFFNRDLRGSDGNHLDGNGRSCNDCHVATQQFRLTPDSAERRFQLLQKRRTYSLRADDPLFRPVDADDFRVNGEHANDYGNLRQNGLVRITFTLPPNMRLIDPITNQPSDETFVDVWRKVPTVRDVKLTGADGLNPWLRGPNQTGGYQLDARFATLQDQALGALLVHAQIQRPPSQRTLDDLASFQRVQFANQRVRALSAAIDQGVSPLPDPDPLLNNMERQGKAVFTRACTQCHGGPGQSTTQLPNVRMHNIATQCPRPVDALTPARFSFAPCPPRLARNARTYQITLPNGAIERRVSSDPGRALLTGFVGGPPPLDDWAKLDMPGLRGLRSLAPYFHNNSASTLEEVVDHYIEFFKLVKVNAPPSAPAPAFASTDGVNFDRAPRPEERDALLAYLRKL